MATQPNNPLGVSCLGGCLLMRFSSCWFVCELLGGWGCLFIWFVYTGGGCWVGKLFRGFRFNLELYAGFKKIADAGG